MSPQLTRSRRATGFFHAVVVAVVVLSRFDDCHHQVNRVVYLGVDAQIVPAPTLPSLSPDALPVLSPSAYESSNQKPAQDLQDVLGPFLETRPLRDEPNGGGGGNIIVGSTDVPSDVPSDAPSVFDETATRPAGELKNVLQPWLDTRPLRGSSTGGTDQGSDLPGAAP
jgi:hypothetical protein